MLAYINRRYTRIKSGWSSEHAETRGDNQRKSACLAGGRAYSSEARQNRCVSAVLVFMLAALAIILIYKTNIEPAMANYACTRAILAGRAGEAEKAIEKYQKALSYNTYQGKYEIRHRLATFVIQYNSKLLNEKKKADLVLSNYTIQELEKNIKSHFLDYVPRLYLGRIYILLINQDKSAGKKAEEAIRRAVEIDDRNPRVWYELGQAYLSQKKYNQAVKAFKTALELNPEVSQSSWFLGIAYFRAGDIG